MKVIETGIPDLLVLEPKVFSDERGYFFESFNEGTFKNNGLGHYRFVQDNESRSRFGVIRGLHYQLAPHAQAKLVRVLQGRVYDVAVDIRLNSPTFGKWFGIELSGENKLQFLIPVGFAHGFSVLSESAVFYYKCSDLYNPGFERGISMNDPRLGINWKIDPEKIIVSERDKNLPALADAEMNFFYGN